MFVLITYLCLCKARMSAAFFTIFLNFFVRYAEFSGGMEGGESEAESDSTPASSVSTLSDSRDTHCSAASDDKRRSAQRKE